MLPEVADLDEALTGQRREGLLYSIMVFLQKITLALGLLIVGQLLAWSGFQQSVPGPIQLLQPNSALTMIRTINTVIPILSLLGSLLLMSLHHPQFYSSQRRVLQPQQVTVSEMDSKG
jgi:GPH family glycoside/pentoside/hexuronide:cation symporter